MHTTAILIFACTAKEESKYRILASDPRKNLNLFEKLNQKTYNLAYSTGLPYYIFDECKQEGDLYGIRIANAISSVYNLGFDKVILIHNNCPGLGLAHIHDALTALKRSNLVIGPNNYGGAYLIGINKSIFSKDSFSQLHWETNLLCHNLKCYNRSKVLLPKLKIMDNVRSAKIFAISEWLDTHLKIPHFPDPFKKKWNDLKAAFVK